MNLSAVTTPRSVAASRLPAIAGAVLLGVFVLFGTGFAQGKGGMLHNAAHDTRHTLVFPCH